MVIRVALTLQLNERALHGTISAFSRYVSSQFYVNINGDELTWKIRLLTVQSSWFIASSPNYSQALTAVVSSLPTLSWESDNNESVAFSSSTFADSSTPNASLKLMDLQPRIQRQSDSNKSSEPAFISLQSADLKSLLQFISDLGAFTMMTSFKFSHAKSMLVSISKRPQSGSSLHIF